MATTTERIPEDVTAARPALHSTDPLAEPARSRLEELSGQIAVIVAATIVTLVIFYLIAAR